MVVLGKGSYEMKKKVIATLVITMSWAPTFAELNAERTNTLNIDEAFMRKFEEETRIRLQMELERSKMEIEKINDLSILEEIVRTDENVYMRRAAKEKLLTMISPHIIQYDDEIIVVDEKGKPYQKPSSEQPKQPLKKSTISILLLSAAVVLLTIFGGIQVWKKKT